MRAAVIIGIVIGILVVCRIAVPNFVNTHRHSPANSCMRNLRLLDSAKLQLEWQNTLPVGAIVEPEQLEPFLRCGTKEGVFPKCPAGGTYELHPTGQLPTCSMKGHVLVP